MSKVRLQSLDALRGFDMIWIVGGAALLNAVTAWTGSEPFMEVVGQQTKHTPWIGMTAWDLIFPLFVFMSGVTMPYALTGKLEKGVSKREVWKGLFRRMALLVLFGWSFSLFKLDWSQFKPSTVLSLIGVAYFIAGGVVIHRPVRSQLAVAFGLLVGYALALQFIPAPGATAGPWTPTGNLAGYLDRHLIPGKLHMGIFDPEGTIRVLPAAAMALFGAVTGQALRNTSTPTARLAGMIALTGVVGVISGLMLGQIVPVIKPLWSSSYIVLSAGWSLILLALFYLLVDVWKQRWLAFPFLPLGMNAITIYVAAHYIDFKFTSSFFFGGLTQFDAEFGKVAITGGVLLVEWLLLYFLYRKKIFLRV